MHAATNKTPFSVIFGFDPCIPMDHAFSHLGDNKVIGVENMVAVRSKL